MDRFSWLAAILLFLGLLAFAGAGCSTAPPPAGAAPLGKTISFQVILNDAAGVKTQFISSSGKNYLGTYRIVINTLNSALIGNQTAITTSQDTWTDYFQLDTSGWTRNHRIALPNSSAPQQFTGFQAITPGTISGNSFTIALSLPDVYLGNATTFNASVITYISPQSDPGNLHAIDALGPTLSGTPIDYLSFNAAVSKTNSKADSGGLGDWLTYPGDFPDLTNSDYQNFDIKSFTVVVQ